MGALHRLDVPVPRFRQVPALAIIHGVHCAHFSIQFRLRQPAELDEDWPALCVSIRKAPSSSSAQRYAVKRSYLLEEGAKTHSNTHTEC